jgi:hypothetical protein
MNHIGEDIPGGIERSGYRKGLWKPVAAVASMLALGGCLTACANSAATTALVGAGVTLGTVAVQNNTTAATLAKQGALACGIVDSTTGQLIASSVKILANAAGVPVSVTGMASTVVNSACPAINLVAGAIPASIDPATVPVVASSAPSVTALPPVTSVAPPTT